MVDRSQQNSNGGTMPTIPRVWFLLCTFLILGALLGSYSALNPDQFAIIGGDEQLVLLLRGENDSHYQAQYVGRNPAELNSLYEMLGGQIFHVEIKLVTIIHNGQEVILEVNGTLPEGSQIIFEPGDEFEVRVAYLDRTLGGNYMYGLCGSVMAMIHRQSPGI